MSKIPKRFPDPPRNKDLSMDDLQLYLELLVREITESDRNKIAGPINSTAFAPLNYTDTRTLNAGTATLQNVRDCLCTLIQILKDGGILK